MEYFPQEGTCEEFIQCYLLRNEPCVFGEWATKSWKARKLWVKEDGTPNFDYLISEFGPAQVSVADCTKCHFTAHPKTEMTLSEYIQYWMAHGSPTAGDDRVLYLKDWHFVQEFPEYGAYTTPQYFSSDWLNEVWAVRQDVDDDYKFVYMGPAGTWTPFHADVLRSYSWSANVCGAKEWLLYRPLDEDKLRDNLGNLPFDVAERKSAPSPLRVIQKAGEVIFVPSGWHHQVRNIEPTISINHNWTNSFGLQRMWQHLQEQLKLVVYELRDCSSMDRWDQHCQVVLRASAGMDYWEFAQFLVVVASPRLLRFQHLLRMPTTDSFSTKLQEFIQEVRGAHQQLTFFKDGIFPSSSLTDSLVQHLEPGRGLHLLYDQLPPDLKAVLGVEQSSELVFRAFEVCRLSIVAEVVRDCVRKLSRDT